VKYDFSRLSGLDFEELVHDLLQREWGTRLEIFRQGPDRGVDLRGFEGNGRLIVQCKNYATSTFSTLRSHIRNEELPKIRSLAPERYVLVTSLPLTVGQKDELTEHLKPYVPSPADIIGGNELTEMLERHPDVVKRHHKLWLTSVAVMERVLHAAEHEQTNAQVERIIRRLPLFVETDAYGRAMEALNTQRVVIISGAPGMGKTTLADMLLYAHVADGFTPAVIRTGLAEGRRLASSGAPTIFHFDDFLGQTYLGDRPEFLGRKEDADLIDFIEWVREHKEHRFVLTTREHVLAEALQRSEKLRHAGIADERCIVTVEDFKRSQRARILYNHLYFSTLPNSYKRELLRNDFFLEIVDCEHFNPRIVEWLSSERRLKSVAVEHYHAHVRALLENPHEIWRHAFSEELSQGARDVLVVLHSLSYVVFVDDLERAFEAFHAQSVQRTNHRTSPGAYRAALKELEGSFIRIGSGEVSFINPSVTDFMSSVMQNEPSLALDLIDTAVRFNQLAGLWEGSAPDGPYPAVRARLKAEPERLLTALNRLVETPSLRWFETKGGRSGRYVDVPMPHRVRELLRMQGDIPEVGLVTNKLIDSVAAQVEKRQLNISDVAGLLEHAWKHRSEGHWDLVSPIVTAVARALDDAWADDWLSLLDLNKATDGELANELPEFSESFERFQKDRLFDEQMSCDDRDRIEQLQDTLERIQERHGVDFRYEISSLEEKLAEEPERQATSFTAREVLDDGSPDLDDDDLRDMFRTLVDGSVPPTANDALSRLA
jgi:hypothetical protein